MVDNHSAHIPRLARVYQKEQGGGSAPTGRPPGAPPRRLPLPQCRRAVPRPAREKGRRRRAPAHDRGPARGRIRVHEDGKVQPVPRGPHPRRPAAGRGGGKGLEGTWGGAGTAGGRRRPCANPAAAQDNPARPSGRRPPVDSPSRRAPVRGADLAAPSSLPPSPRPAFDPARRRSPSATAAVITSPLRARSRSRRRVHGAARGRGAGRAGQAVHAGDRAERAAGQGPHAAP